MAVRAAPEASGDLPPHNLEAETSVLGAILLSDRTLDAILVEIRLRAADFYRPRHAAIYAAMLRLREKSPPEPVDALTVCEELDREGKLEEVGDRAFVHSLPATVPAAANAPHYARIVKEHSLMRGLLDATRTIQDDVRSFAGNPRELLDRAEAKLYGIAHEEESRDVRPLGDVLGEELRRLGESDGREVTGTPSGYGRLDSLTGGFQPGNLIIVAARTGRGKSALAINIADRAAVEHGRKVALFSLEMSEVEIAHRFLAARGPVDSHKLRLGRLTQRDWNKAIRASERLAQAKIFIDDSSSLSALELRAKARRLAAHNDGLDLIIVDYLQLMRPDDMRIGRVEQIGQISRALKILAGELKVPVIALAQLSRAVEQRPGGRPILSDLRESGNIEQDADVVMFIAPRREVETAGDEDDRDDEIELDIAKHRNGPTGKVDLVWLASNVRFVEPPPDSITQSMPPGPGRASGPGLRVVQDDGAGDAAGGAPKELPPDDPFGAGDSVPDPDDQDPDEPF